MHNREPPQNFKPITARETAKQGKIIFVIRDSHIKRIGLNDFNKELKHGKAFFCSFSGANAKGLYHYIIPTLIDDLPDAVNSYVATNDVLNHSHKNNQYRRNRT